MVKGYWKNDIQERTHGRRQKQVAETERNWMILKNLNPKTTILILPEFD